MAQTIPSDEPPATLKLADTSTGDPTLGETRKELFVLAGDMVGYSELVFRNAEDGVRNLVASRGTFVKALKANGGRVVATPGDFVLAAFNTAWEAIVAGIAAQTALLERGASAASWRIGIAFGDVFEVEGDIYGHAVNVASRIQSLATPGQILMSDDVSSRLPVGCAITTESLGHHQLKKIDEQVHIHCVASGKAVASIRSGSDGLPARFRDSISKPIVELQSFDPQDDSISTRFFASSLQDEIHLILARLTNSITVRGEATGSKIKPNYILRGSIGGRGQHLRIMPRLVSFSDGATIWAERYDYNLRDSFDAQDEIAWEIVSALQLALTDGEQAQIWKRGTQSGLAWEAFQRGHDEERRYTREGHRQAKQFYSKALSIDPDYLCALVAFAFIHLDEVRLGWTDNVAYSIHEAEIRYELAARIDARHSDVLALLGFLRLLQGKSEDARRAMESAVASASHSPEIVGYQGALLDLLGDFPAAIRAYQRAASLSHHVSPWILGNLALSNLALGQAREAELVCREVVISHPGYVRAWLGLTVALVRQNKLGDALNAASRLLELDPKFTITDWSRAKPFADDALLSAFAHDMEKAGIPK
ncbi:tetratricopeptide repeat protein [Mesorhizobium sp. M0408]|uniref:tetratricopeptide repeat protein n=1 Tax=Mesorhizobium sp. M0408 TaxID=2956942 RepID=UPI0033390C7F